MAEFSIKKIVFNTSEGILENLTDFVLGCFFLCSFSIGKSGSRGMYKAFVEMDRELEKINYQTFKRAIVNLKKNKLVQLKGNNKKFKAEITGLGRVKLEESFTAYKEKRKWDKKIFLVTYDIPEKKHATRDVLRRYLRKIGCALLQESVWIVPNNPKEELKKFVKEKGLEGTILVSDLGAGGSIGDENITDLVNKVYKLEELNCKYREFINKFTNRANSKAEILFQYYKILGEDPQLPFELLPKDWLGEEAYKLLRKSYRIE